MMNDNFKIGIIGAGKLSSILSFYCQQYNKLGFVIARNSNSKSNLLNHGIYKNLILHDLSEIEHIPEVIILAVNDDSINAVVNDIITNFSSKISNCLIVHCSGVLQVEILSELQNYGSKIAACHPFQTFFKYRTDLLQDVPWGIDCNAKTFDTVDKLIRFFKGSALILSEENKEKKALYHLSAVASSNFLISAIEYANLCAKESGIEPRLFLRKLAETSLQNALDSIDSDTELPLTGPIVRGDINCINQHLAHLENTNLSFIYKAFATANLEIAFLKEKIGNDKYNEIGKLLNF